jgi:membrane fusion protein, multidrug efflux system
VLAPRSRERREARPAARPRPDGKREGQEAEASKPEDGGEQPRPNLLRRHPFLAVAAVVLLLVALAAGYLYWDYASHFQSTDDAFIGARQFAVSPKVAGTIAEVPVTDNQHVSAGDVIARLDDRDYRTALNQAEAQVASAKASIQNIEAQIAVQQQQITASQAQVEEAQAGLTYAQQQEARYKELAQREAGTVQMAQQTESALRQSQASLQSAQATLAVSQRQLDVLKAQRVSADASLDQASAQRDQA